MHLAPVKSALFTLGSLTNKIPRRLSAWTNARACRIAAGVLVFYFVFAWLAINPLGQWLLPWVAESQLASRASVQKVSFDPLRLTATIDQLALTEKNGAPLASFKQLVVDIELSGLFDRAWKLKHISVNTPRIHVLISKQGKLNWADLLAKLNEKPSPPDEPLPRVIIEHLTIQHGDIQYRDAQRATPLVAGITPLDFTLEGFSTLPKDRGDYLIAAKLPAQGGTLKWKGNLGVNPLASKGTLAIADLQLPKLMQWLPPQALPVQVEAGRIASQFDYDFSLSDTQQPKLVLTDLALRLQALQCQLAQHDKLSLAQLAVHSKRLQLSRQPTLAINTEDLTVGLDQLQLQKPQAIFSVGTSSIVAPSLGLGLDQATQVSVDRMQVKVMDTQLQHAGQPLLTLPELAIANIHFNLAARKASIASIALNRGQVAATQEANGSLNWQTALGLPNAPPAQSAAASPAAVDAAHAAAPVQLSIGEIALAHWQLAYDNRQFAQPLHASVGDFNLHATLDNQRGLRLDNVQLQATGLKLLSDHTPMAQLAQLSLKQGQLLVDQQTASVAAIALQGLKTQVIRQADQRLNWQAAMSPAAHAHVAKVRTPPPATQSPWAFSLRRLSLQQAEVHVEDLTTPTPVVLDVTDGNVLLADLSQDLHKQRPIHAGFQLKQGGQFNVQGHWIASPFQAKVSCKLADLALPPFAPYLQQFTRLQLQRGAVNLQGSAHLDTHGASQFAGGFAVNQLLLLEEDNQQAFLGWDALRGDGLTLAPDALHLRTLTLNKPVGKLIIYPDHSINFAKFMRNQAQSSSPANAHTVPDSSAGANGFAAGIDSVRIQDAELAFADLSLAQPFGTQIHSLGGVINGISSKPGATAQVELDGKVDAYGAARIRGALQPFNSTEFTDLKLAFSNLEMNRLTPYSGKFAGRTIESGKLSVDLAYNIKQRKLSGDNKFVIHKLTLGNKVDSKEAANLPLDLAIAILEDRNGVIDLDLPVTGSLDDPKFSIGSIVWKAFTNVLTKIVTAPFAALGKLFGADEQLQAVAFDPGTATLLPPELEKLHTVSQALDKRRQLRLGIVPGYDVAADTRALQETALRKQVAVAMGITLDNGQSAGPIDLNNPQVQSVIQGMHDRLTQKPLLKRLAAKLEKTPEGFYAQAQEALTLSMPVSEHDLQALAHARAAAMQSVLTNAGIDTARIVIHTPVISHIERNVVQTKLTLEAM